MRKLRGGTKIVVATKESPPVRRYFLAADDSDLFVLDLTDPSLPRQLASVLPHLAVKVPGTLAAMPWGNGVSYQNVTVRADGVFIGPRRAADLKQLVHQTPRSDVVEIKMLSKAGGSDTGAGIGAAGGFFLGLGVGREVCCGSGGVLMALLFGLPAVGALLGYRVTPQETEVAIYRAP